MNRRTFHSKVWAWFRWPRPLHIPNPSGLGAGSVLFSLLRARQGRPRRGFRPTASLSLDLRIPRGATSWLILGCEPQSSLNLIFVGLGLFMPSELLSPTMSA